MDEPYITATATATANNNNVTERIQMVEASHYKIHNGVEPSIFETLFILIVVAMVIATFSYASVNHYDDFFKASPPVQEESMFPSVFTLYGLVKRIFDIRYD